MNLEQGLRITTPSDREVAWTRDFDAPARSVFEAHTKPELLRQWLLGPEGWQMPICEVDLRVGGKYRYVWSHPDKGQMTIRGEYREIVPYSRLVNTERFDDPWYPGEALVTSRFEESQGRTRLSVVMRLETKEGRDAVLKSGMETGLEPSYRRLEQVIEK